MVHKLLEDLLDNFLFAVGVFGVLIFFIIYWERSFQIRYAEVVIHDFLWKASVSGKVTKDDYESLHRNLYSIDPKYDLEMQWVQYLEHPEYKLFSENELKQYFQERNRKKNILLKEYDSPVLQAKPEELTLQKETNASLLAAEKTELLPLPMDGTETVVTAVRPEQEVYEGEKLITLCKVLSQNVNYYVEAKDVIAKNSGEIDLEVVVDGIVYKVPVQVICHPRIVECKNGHTVTNEKMIIESQKQTGIILCPYCRLLSGRISCEISELSIKAGEKLTRDNIGIHVYYMDESYAYITPESEGWQDNYDEEFCGRQLVTIRYRNAETRLVISSENSNCIQCGNKCNDRCAEDYENYPYCLKCLSRKYIFTGQVRTEEQILYGNELLSILDNNRELIFSRGDFIVLKYGLGRRKTIVQRKVSIDGT